MLAVAVIDRTVALHTRFRSGVEPGGRPVMVQHVGNIVTPLELQAWFRPETLVHVFAKPC
jgi:hypothetical protein